MVRVWGLVAVLATAAALLSPLVMPPILRLVFGEGTSRLILRWLGWRRASCSPVVVRSPADVAP